MSRHYHVLKRRFKNMSKREIRFLIKNEIKNSDSFKQHLQEVSLTTKIHPEIVEDVLLSYIANILIAINTIRVIKTKINVYGFFSIIIGKGSYI